MTSLADKIRHQLKAGKTPKKIAAMFGTSQPYVRAVRRRTGTDGFPRSTEADLDWAFNRRQQPDHNEYYRQKAMEHYWRHKAAKLSKLKQAPRQIAQRILSEVEIAMLIRATKTDRDRLMLDLAYFGGLRASEIVTLTWAQVIKLDSGDAQLSIVGKGSKGREVLIPAVIAARLFASQGEAPASALVFESVQRPGSPLTLQGINFIIKETAERAGVNPAVSIRWLRDAHVSHAIDNGAPITLVSATLSHADLKTTSVYAHARPAESSGQYLKTEF
jgi:site-specific recombinase XerD